jgi:hypothetical protein
MSSITAPAKRRTKRMSEASRLLTQIFIKLIVSLRELSSDDIYREAIKNKKLTHEKISALMPGRFKHFIAIGALQRTGKFVLGERDSQPRPVYRSNTIKR